MVHDSRPVDAACRSLRPPRGLAPTHAPRNREPPPTLLGASRCTSFLSAYQDREIRRWHTRRPSTETQVRERFDAYRQEWECERGGHWEITRDGLEVLGRIELRGLDFDDGIGGVAYWVLPAARGADVASRAVSALTAWALNEIGFHCLQLDHSARNHASCRVATKSGYLLEGPSAAPPSTTTADTTCTCTPHPRRLVLSGRLRAERMTVKGGRWMWVVPHRW
ncbi:hypothetical protein MBT84_37805 [Streptomyces sp. MBT84]|uniref:GNAT family N-acetyltransferase n=1 Tax=unclassified Streptomyces TaxID=2593676 RepID=UPI001DE84ED4|nr:hypothetical protein [Streptomyces sp. MBT84]